jgi:hypothetical protein
MWGLQALAARYNPKGPRKKKKKLPLIIHPAAAATSPPQWPLFIELEISIARLLLA